MGPIRLRLNENSVKPENMYFHISDQIVVLFTGSRPTGEQGLQQQGTLQSVSYTHLFGDLKVAHNNQSLLQSNGFDEIFEMWTHFQQFLLSLVIRNRVYPPQFHNQLKMLCASLKPKCRTLFLLHKLVLTCDMFHCLVQRHRLFEAPGQKPEVGSPNKDPPI